MSWLAKQEGYYENGRIGHLVVMLTSQSCLGAVSGYLSIINDNMTLACIGLTLCFASNAIFLANMKPKVAILGFLASVVYSGFVLLMWLALSFVG